MDLVGEIIKKKILIYLIIIILSFNLAGCVNSQTPAMWCVDYILEKELKESEEVLFYEIEDVSGYKEKHETYIIDFRIHKKDTQIAYVHTYCAKILLKDIWWKEIVAIVPKKDILGIYYYKMYNEQNN